MFQRFTERARKVVELAQEEARRFNHDYIGTEHLLLGLLREEQGVAALTLSDLSITLGAAREQVEGLVGSGEETTGGRTPFTPPSKKALEMALREALQLGHNYVGTEHVLLGLVHQSEGISARVLSNLGVSPDDIRREVVLRVVGGGRPRDPRRLLFRGRVLAFEVHMRYGRLGQRVVPQPPQTLLVELDYAYTAQEAGDVLLGTLAPDDLCEGVVRVLEGEEFGLLEAGIVRAGEYVLEEFPAVQEITVSVTAPRASESRRSPEVRLSRTFRR